MTNYGEICTAWFDMPMTLTQEQSQRIYEVGKALQPDCLINSSLGHGKYDYVSLGDNEIPETMEVMDKDNVDYNDVNGVKPSPYGLYETAATMNKTWGFSYHDHNWKSPEKIYELKKHLNSMGVNYLLNIGLDGLGRIPMASVKALKAVAEMEKEKK